MLQTNYSSWFKYHCRLLLIKFTEICTSSFTFKLLIDYFSLPSRYNEILVPFMTTKVLLLDTISSHPRFYLAVSPNIIVFDGILTILTPKIWLSLILAASREGIICKVLLTVEMYLSLLLRNVKWEWLGCY